MRKPITLLPALFMTVSSFAQNIVQNPDFELHSQCPGNVGQLDRCDGWSSPSVGSPDYFHVCCTLNTGVPENLFGYQQPASDSAYAGVITYFYGGTYKEYMEGHLTTPTLPGQYYRVSMKVSYSENNQYAAGGLGVFFSTDSISSSAANADVLPYTPQVNYSVYGIITDTANWITLADTFYADSAYRFLTIGNYQPNSSMTADSTGYGLSVNAYYYIDDIEVASIAVGIAGPEKNGAVTGIYPHPLIGSSEVRFNNPEHDAYFFSIFNMQGQLVNRITDIRSDKFIISKGELPSGIYYYQLGSSATMYAGKLVVN